MREIKFRGYECSNNGFVYGYLVKGLSKICIVPDLGGIQWDVFPESIGQYTGLKDKNGVEIYEGDIVKCIDQYGNKEICQIEYNADTFDYPAFDITPNPVGDTNGISHYYCSGSIEVIGNIYENPDLLPLP